MTVTVSSDRVVIVGAGQAGGSAAAFLRQYGHTGPIVLIGDEPLLPYRRPPPAARRSARPGYAPPEFMTGKQLIAKRTSLRDDLKR